MGYLTNEPIVLIVGKVAICLVEYVAQFDIFVVIFLAVRGCSLSVACAHLILGPQLASGPHLVPEPSLIPGPNLDQGLSKSCNQYGSRNRKINMDLEIRDSTVIRIVTATITCTY